MDQNLKDNLCNLANKDIHKAEVEESRVQMFISACLQYACTNWLLHLEAAIPLSDTILDLLENQLFKFFDTHVLQWIECMSWLNKLDHAARSLENLKQLNKVYYYLVSEMVANIQ